MLCHLSDFVGHRRWLLLRLLLQAAVLVDSTNESWNVRLIKLSCLIFAALAATRELDLQIGQSRVRRNRYTVSIDVMVYSIGKGWIGVLVTSGAATLLS